MNLSFDAGIIELSKCEECNRYTFHVADEENNSKCCFCDPTFSGSSAYEGKDSANKNSETVQ